MAVKPYIQQAASALQQAIQALQQDQKSLGQQTTQEKSSLQGERDNFDRLHKATEVAKRNTDDNTEERTLNQQMQQQEQAMRDKANRMQDVEKQEQNRQQHLNSVRRELEALAANVQSLLGRVDLS